MKKERSKKYRAIQSFRILSQTVFFGLFFYLLFKTHFTGQDYISRVEVFFHFDPLLAIATAIASRVLFASFILAGVTLVVTLIAGRYVCGWVCPLGSVHQFFSFVFKKAKLLKPRKEEKSAGRLAWKYYILIAVLVGSLFTVDLVGIADPLSFLYRSFATGIIPGSPAPGRPSSASSTGSSSLRRETPPPNSSARSPSIRHSSRGSSSACFFSASSSSTFPKRGSGAVISVRPGLSSASSPAGT